MKTIDVHATFDSSRGPARSHENHLQVTRNTLNTSLSLSQSRAHPKSYAEEAVIKSRRLTFITAMTLFAAVAVPVRLAAQHTRYKLIDIGTLGGPNSSAGFEGFPLNALSSQGVFTACADTSVHDQDYPNINPFIFPGLYGLPFPDPLIFHAFQWKNGTLTDLGALPGNNNSCSSHISGNGLIAGESENGVVDPITGWPEVQAVLWKNGQLINLGSLGGNESYSTAVNNRGQVVGDATNTTPDPFLGFGQQVRAFFWESGVMRDVGTLGGPDAIAVDINDRGQVRIALIHNSVDFQAVARFPY